ncbi:hypothetical protein [Caballeronia grimmiae]|uniref:hypothetical protein n=1 Tax=Caballeronia grimmiae TaxID=1071679 RepID=UPI0038BCD263
MTLIPAKHSPLLNKVIHRPVESTAKPKKIAYLQAFLTFHFNFVPFGLARPCDGLAAAADERAAQ